MKKISILISLLFSTFIMTGCSNKFVESEFIESGFLNNSESSEISPWLSTAIKGKKTQKEKAILTAYAGYHTGFVNKWNNFSNKPNYERVVLQRCIRDRLNNDITSAFFDLPDFFNESKYEVRDIENNDGSSRHVFTFKYEDRIPLSEITTERGRVYYKICLLDENNQVIKENLGIFGPISISDLYFKKIDNKITFALYERDLN